MLLSADLLQKERKNKGIALQTIAREKDSNVKNKIKIYRHLCQLQFQKHGTLLIIFRPPRYRILASVATRCRGSWVVSRGRGCGLLSSIKKKYEKKKQWKVIEKNKKKKVVKKILKRKSPRVNVVSVKKYRKSTIKYAKKFLYRC